MDTNNGRMKLRIFDNWGIMTAEIFLGVKIAIAFRRTDRLLGAVNLSPAEIKHRRAHSIAQKRDLLHRERTSPSGRRRQWTIICCTASTDLAVTVSDFVDLR